MAGALHTIYVSIVSNQIVLNPAILQAVVGDYFHWHVDKGSISSAEIDFPISKLFSGGAHFPVTLAVNCEFVRPLPEVVPVAAKDDTYYYYIAASPIACSEALVVQGQIHVAP